MERCEFGLLNGLQEKQAPAPSVLACQHAAGGPPALPDCFWAPGRCRCPARRAVGGLQPGAASPQKQQPASPKLIAQHGKLEQRLQLTAHGDIHTEDAKRPGPPRTAQQCGSGRHQWQWNFACCYPAGDAWAAASVVSSHTTRQ